MLLYKIYPFYFIGKKGYKLFNTLKLNKYNTNFRLCLSN